MVEVSEIGLKGEEVELDLGLSIGGCFRKSEKLKPVERELVIPFISRNNSVEVDLRLNQTTLFRSGASPSEIDSGHEIVDLQTKRNIQALRRQVAKKKQQKKRWRGRNSMIENAIEDQRASKRDKTDSSRFEYNGVKNGNLNMCNTQTEKHPVHPVQFVPYTHGFAYPFLMPCWNPTGKEKNWVEPANCQGFRPFLPHQSLGLNDKREGETKITTSNGSPKCSSSSVFDHPSSSQEGGGSSDTGTNSSCSFKDQQEGCKENASNGHFELSACSRATPCFKERTHYNEKVMPKLVNHLSSIGSKEETTLQSDSMSSLLRAAKVDCGKPPKPQAQNQNTSTFPQMPYVSTTGNGLNEKTITGLLYRYTKSEVSIMCVCHGSTFSPAEFVQHAGSIDIANPLKHITVIPS